MADGERKAEIEVALSRWGMWKPDYPHRVEWRLRDIGLPRAVIAYVKTELGPDDGSISALPRVMTVLLSGLAFFYYLLHVFERIVDRNARLKAEQIEGLLYEHNFGLAFLVASPVGIFAALVVAGFCLSDRATVSDFASSVMKGSPARYRRLASRIGGELDPIRYIRRLIWMDDRWKVLVCVVLMAISALLLVRDVHTYSIFTEDAYVRSPFLPWGDKGPKFWSSAASAETGCNHVEPSKGVRGGDRMVYDGWMRWKKSTIN